MLPTSSRSLPLGFRLTAFTPANLKRVLKGDDAAAIRQSSDVLTRAAHKLAESMVQQPGASQDGGPQPGQGGHNQAGAQAPGNDDVVDAEYEEVA